MNVIPLIRKSPWSIWLVLSAALHLAAYELVFDSFVSVPEIHFEDQKQSIYTHFVLKETVDSVASNIAPIIEPEPEIVSAQSQDAPDVAPLPESILEEFQEVEEFTEVIPVSIAAIEPQEVVEPTPVLAEPIPLQTDLPEERDTQVTPIATPVEIPQSASAPEIKGGAQYEQSGPVPILNPAPDYPRVAIQRKMSGIVWLNVLISDNGKPEVCEILESSGYSLLDRKAQDTILKRWKFGESPETQRTATIRIDFKLE